MRAYFPAICIIFSGCVGTDLIDDPVVGEKIDVNAQEIALMPGGSFDVLAVYSDKYGIVQDVPLTWTTSVPSVAAVDETGRVTALTVGQSVIQPSYQTFSGPLINVVVVTDASEVASVEISAAKSTLSVGEKIQLSATAKNIDGQALTGQSFEWFSENSAILNVSPSGEVTALEEGVAGVHAKASGVKSSSINFTVGLVRTGQFAKAGGYEAEGTAVLKVENLQLVLELESDFKTSFALGTFIYLANSTSGPAVKSNGFEVAQITDNGAKTFNISQLNPNIQLYDYRYVIILCKPASVTFGFADLQ